jgi:excisionase family DNA binding protein
MGIASVEPPLEPLIDAKEAAKYLGFSVNTIKRWAHEGKIPCIAFVIGSNGKCTYRFRVSELKIFLGTMEHHPSSMTIPTLVPPLESRANL